jgi:hypothetical protein
MCCGFDQVHVARFFITWDLARIPLFSWWPAHSADFLTALSRAGEDGVSAWLRTGGCTPGASSNRSSANP